MDTIAIQGDLRIIKINAIPKEAIKRKDKILLKGEVTGHAHRLTNGDVYNLDERILFTVLYPAEIIHEEHLPIPLEIGKYEIIRQREYTNKDAVELVTD